MLQMHSFIGEDVRREIVRQGTIEIDDQVVEPFEPYIIIEGILEKLKARSDFFNVPRSPFFRVHNKEKWVKRYFILRCNDPQSFTLEQLADESPKGKVRRVIKMEWVVKVLNNLKNKNKQWIFCTHYCMNPSDEPSKVYLAAKSEEQPFEDMNRWVTEFCKACGLQQQKLCEDGSETRSLSFSLSPCSVDGRFDEKPPEKVVNGRNAESFASTDTALDGISTSMNSNVFTNARSSCETTLNDTGYTLLKNCNSGAETPIRIVADRRLNSDDVSARQYIHLKNCASSVPNVALSATVSTHSLNQSTSYDRFSLSNDLGELAPPPRPPKTKQSLQLNNSSTRDSSGEFKTDGGQDEGSAISLKSSDNSIASVSTSSSILNGAPPKIDRSCKPRMREDFSYANKVPLPPRRYRDSTSSPSPQLKALSSSTFKTAVPVIPRTNPRNRMQLDSLKSEENIGSGKNGQQEQPSKAVEYLDPVQNFDDVSSGSSNLIAASDSNIPSKLRNGRVEYALVNEESTQAVINANLMQNVLRTNNSNW